MIENITSVSKEERESHEKTFGGFNSPPPNFVEITSEEFATGGFFTWCIEKVEFRQVRVDENKPMLALRMFFMNHGDHYALHSDHRNKRVQYFKFAVCLHEYKLISSTMRGDNTAKCTKCGDIWQYDSSD